MPLDPKKLKAAREKRGLTQEAVATAAGLPRSYLAAMEGGAKINPPLSTAEKVAEALGCSLVKLLA